MKRYRCIRALVRLLVYGLIGLGCLLVTSIWWLPRALPSLLRLGAVEVAEVSRQASGRLLLSGVDYASDAVRLSVDSVEIPALHQYLWERFAVGFSDASLVAVGAVELQVLVADDEAVADEATEMDTVTMVRDVRAAMARYGAWVPPVKLSEWVVRSPEGASLLAVRALRLRDWQLQAWLETTQLPEALAVHASLDPEVLWVVEVEAKATGLASELILEPTADGFDVAFELRQAAETAAGRISFVAGQGLPVRATFRAERFSIDSQWLPQLEDVQWQAVALSAVDIGWEAGRYSGVLNATGLAAAGTQPAIPLSGSLEFSGDLNTLQVDVLTLSGGWGQLDLSQPVSIALADGRVSQEAELKLALDLSKQAIWPVGGRVTARFSVAPSFAAGPNVRFEMSVDDFVYDQLEVAGVALAGRLEGQVLTLERLQLQPLATGTDVVALSGVADFAAETLDFDYAVLLSPDWINQMIEPLTVANALQTRGRVSGSLQQPIFSGSLDPLTLESAGVTPITVSGNYVSEGVQQFSIEGRAAAAGAVIDVGFVIALGAERVQVELNELVWTDPVRPTLKLESPTYFSYQFAGAAAFPEERLLVGPFRVLGPELEIQGAWDPAAGLAVQLRNVTLQRLGRWVDRELPSLTVESVALSLSELRPRVLGAVEAHFESQAVGEATPLRVDVSAQFTASSLVVDGVQLKFADTALLDGAITAPITFQLPVNGASVWELLEAGDLEAELTGTVTPAFADWLVRTSDVNVSEALLNLKVTGSMEQPIGLLELQVASLESPLAGGVTVEGIEILAKAESDSVQLERFKLLLNNSEVSGAIRLPMEGLMAAVLGDMEQRQAWLARGTGRLELIDWQAEDWVDFLPAMMRRSGRLSGLLELQPNWDFSGRLSFQEFALRPTESLPSVDLIGGQLELSERKLLVKQASAQIGGSPVTFEGWLDASDWRDPLWDFAVSGLNVPLVRTTDMILRSDLDVQASHTDRSETPVIRGDLHLRSSTMLVEFDPLAPSVESGPQSKPPFFSITEPAIADWRFDLRVAGDSFMRVRSPYFRTQLTANFELGGTFSEPLLIGSVRTVDGELRFPGATVRITSGEAYIEQGRPNTVQLDFNGIAQKASYIITMDVTQTLDDPHIHFQSTPDLSNASIVRLLTTGSVSGGGVGTVGLYLGQGLLGAGGMDEQFSDRLSVDVGEETSRSGRNTVGVRYDLTEDLFLEGGYDVYDAYNLDLIWSIFKR